MGGPSAEHEVSLLSGEVIYGHLDREKYEVTPVIVTKDGEWPIGVDKLKNEVDIVFIAMHGEYGEDGVVQGLLRDAEIPFTGSDVLASALSMNKILSGRLLASHGLNIPHFIVAHKHEGVSVGLEDLDFPVIVKPANRGSSVGVTIVRTEDDLRSALEKAFGFSRDAIIQEFIPGREVTCAVLDDGLGDAFPLPPTEVIPRLGAMFDYEAKYTPGASDEITPANLHDDAISFIQEVAVITHRAVGASGMSRTDMIIGEDDVLYVLEINTIPGMTPTSLLPQAAKVHGLTFSDLLDRIIDAGQRRHGLLLR